MPAGREFSDYVALSCDESSSSRLAGFASDSFDPCSAKSMQTTPASEAQADKQLSVPNPRELAVRTEYHGHVCAARTPGKSHRRTSQRSLVNPPSSVDKDMPMPRM